MVTSPFKDKIMAIMPQDWRQLFASRPALGHPVKIIGQHRDDGVRYAIVTNVFWKGGELFVSLTYDRETVQHAFDDVTIRLAQFVNMPGQNLWMGEHDNRMKVPCWVCVMRDHDFRFRSS